ncbi:Zinc-binding alcohol dehydrogenase [Leptospira biflexa serovar Patoc strain 'Patoc 1 (Ames)']|uniref:Putative zinc-containing alcohol dehydrogenase superfamily n=1 Tax=Leptospira biflexa serovar Patoc (strain Patoc 1 / ATCC 23582 / Paris) TaxID=456481 RepID=B0SQJ3_LEPBP|nr:NADP-dependent oxidoreductase [Leptospira biflexa]ABZ94004.1 Zinc-binding alcohol dehydrogenase [Leptospira biflexa serovar Patoc strain 'Patoc 1 (Ames)']ABZ97651.1 Putative zinc-containing alcohol dehydrogenase superfamily [Leptospira biflexa serovar Patoc strain 'Patoc 1 (Paris)']
MKAFTINRYNKHQNLQLTEVSDPILNDHDVLVQIHAAGINLLDSKLKSGEFKLILPYQLPLILGHDFAGIILKVGPKVQKFKIGEEVFGRVRDFRIGTFAEQIAVSEDDIAKKPKHLTMEEAASIPLVGLTSWQALVENANIQKGQKVFIQAGSGGVGTFAIQLAKVLGAEVATTTSHSNFELVKRLGADTIIDYKTTDFESILKDYDVVIHSQDGKTLHKSLRILKPGGKLISISGPPDINFAKEMKFPWFLQFVIRMLSLSANKKAKERNVQYSFLFMKANGSQLNQISNLINEGRIQPVIDKIYPFEALNDALAYVESGRAKGKVVVKML